MTTPQNSDIIALFRPRAGLPGATFQEFGAALPQSSTPVEDEGTQVVASPTALNFIGAGVTAANNAGVADITIPGAAAIGLDGLTDVTLTAPATGEILFKSAADWLNTSAIVVTPTGSIVLKFNGSTRLTTVNPGVLLNRGANDDVQLEILSESNADAVLLLTNNLVGGVRLFLNPTGGVASIQQTDAAGSPQDTWLLFTRDGAVEGRHNNVAMFRSALAATGGMEVNNTVTGAGFERVLTTADLGGGAGLAGVTSLGSTSDQSFTTASPVAINTITVALEAGKAYRYQHGGILENGNSTPKFKIGHVFSGTLNQFYQGPSIQVNQAQVLADVITSGFITDLRDIDVTVGGTNAYQIQGIISVNTAGNLTLRGQQQAADAGNPTILQARSVWLTCIELA